MGLKKIRGNIPIKGYLKLLIELNYRFYG